MLTLLIYVIGATVIITLSATSAYMGFVAARSNGWRELAKKFRHRDRSPKNRLRFQTTSLNEYSFPGTMQIGATEHGLWLKPWLLLFHPPLLMPWDHLKSIRLEGRFDIGVRLEAADGVHFVLEMSESTRSALLETTDKGWLAARRALLAETPIVAKR